MQDINLLPWRSIARKKRKKLVRISLIISLFLAVLVLSAAHYFYAQSVKPKKIQQNIMQQINKPNDVDELAQFKWVGYIHFQDEFVGLVMFSNGKTIDVQAGSWLNQKIRVIRVDEHGIVVKQNGKEERVRNAI